MIRASDADELSSYIKEPKVLNNFFSRVDHRRNFGKSYRR